MVGYRRACAAQSCLCVLIQHADRLRVLVSRSCPRRDCGGWAAAASPALLWTAACLSDSARESGLGTRCSEYRRYYVRGCCSAICKVRQTFRIKIHEGIKIPRASNPWYHSCGREDLYPRLALIKVKRSFYLLITIDNL